MEYFSEKYGLVTDIDKESENAQLFLAQYIILTKVTSKYENLRLAIDTMGIQLANSFTGIKGLYHRNPDLIDRRSMSHDNISGIMSYSFLFGTQHRFAIWNYLVKHLGTYDNTQNKSKELSRFLPFNPSNFFIWGLCAKSYIYLLFLPFFLINTILTCRKPSTDTSGKILLWVEMYPHKEHWLVKHIFKYYHNRMINMYGQEYEKALLLIYHGGNSAEFPIKKLLNNV